MTKKSVFDLDENIVAALSYVFGPFSGIFVLVMEKENKFVRFHALQSTLWFLMLMVIGWIIGIIGSVFGSIFLIGLLFRGVFSIIGGIVSMVSLISWIFLMVKAYGGATFKIPIIGDVVWSQVNK
jgi:uncharacterized membrane protein